MADNFAFSVRAAFGVMDSYNMSEAAMLDVMQGLKAAGKIRSDGYVLQSDLDAAMRKRRAA
jgi:hypothetical protein